MVLVREAPPKYYSNHQDDSLVCCGLPRQTHPPQHYQNPSLPIGQEPPRHHGVDLPKVQASTQATEPGNSSRNQPCYSELLSDFPPPAARATHDGNYIHAMPNEDISNVDIARWVASDTSGDVKIGFTLKALIAELLLLIQKQPRVEAVDTANAIRDALSQLSFLLDPNYLQKEFLDIGEATDDEKPEQEEIPIDSPPAILSWLKARCEQMRQAPKKALGPLIVHLMDPDKRNEFPYTKGNVVGVRPAYWAPPDLCPEYKGIHHTNKEPLDNLLPWFFLLPFCHKDEATKCIERARRQYPDRTIRDWAAMLEIAVNEFAHGMRKRKYAEEWESAKAEIRCFRESCRVVRECLAGIDRDGDDVFMADKVPKLAQKNGSGRKPTPGVKRKRATKTVTKRVTKTPATKREGFVYQCPTPSGDDDGSDTEIDDDDVPSQKADIEKNNSGFELREDEDMNTAQVPQTSVATGTAYGYGQSATHRNTAKPGERHTGSALSSQTHEATDSPKRLNNLSNEPDRKLVDKVQYLSNKTPEPYHHSTVGTPIAETLQQPDYYSTPPDSTQTSFSNAELYLDNFSALAGSEANSFFEANPYGDLSMSGLPPYILNDTHPPMESIPFGVDPDSAQATLNYNNTPATSSQEFTPSASQGHRAARFDQYHP